jgi:holliday junction DNA helicase RuvA
VIGRLTGRLVEKQPPQLVIDVQGVGYEVLAPMTTFYQLPALGEITSLHTHLSISEAAHQLFGFANAQDRSFFRLLIKVSGVGPKMALAILSAMEAQECAHCILQNNLVALVKIPGVGKKIAERLVIEMRDRLKDWAPHSSAKSIQEAPQAQQVNAMVAEAESALVALGYKPAEAAKAILAAMKQTELARTEDIIRAVLRAMSPN